MVLLSGNANAAEEFSAEAFLQATPAEGLASGLGARLDGGSTFLSLEGRGGMYGTWTGRATAGLDVFGRSDRFDLTLGLFLGTNGSTAEPSIEAAGTAGFELGLGVHLGSLHGRYRHADGFRGPLESRLTEDEWRLGYRMFDTVEVFGQYIHYNPGEYWVVDGYGVGAKVVF